ncbi:SDR family oxidoreductase [Curtobacterium sp. RRHDQ10]|uniref:SDR family oxidoreductase n=1 Tax=Curtobacterium phyllosphaerae TaxID=3413379 RepID=UPI003BF354A4
MRVFITGAAGHIGTAVVEELVHAGHDVVGLVRSDRSAAVVGSHGGTPLHGDVNDLDLLRRAASDADAVVHLAFDNAAAANGEIGRAADADRLVVRTVGDALAGTGKAFIGIGIATTGDPDADRAMEANPRTFVARELLALTDRDVRAMLVGVPPVTHSDRDRHGFVPILIGIARRRGVSGYVDDGANTWPAVHTLDLARLYRLALEQAPAGTQVIGAAEPGIPVRDIATAIGRGLGIETRSIPAADAAEHFAPFPFMGMDIVMPNDATRALLGWEPTHPSLLEDLASGYSFG